MSSKIARRCALIIILLITGTLAHADGPARRWRIGIAGAFSTGYLGLMALHGLPRERLDDDDVLSLSKLKQYDMVIIGLRGYANAEAAKVLEDYVRDGGIALTETLPIPSEQALPGRRIGPAPTPNIRFIDSGTPVTAGCPELGLIGCAGLNGASIVPTSPDAVVLARFTDEGAPRKMQGRFVENNQGLPAIIMVPLGKGKLIYSGASLSHAISLRGRELEPFLVNLLKYVSDGQLVDRMYSGTVERSELVTAQEPQEPQKVYQRPAGSSQPPPADYETLEEAANLRDFALRGTLQPGKDMRLLISYWSPRSYRELLISKGKATLSRRFGTTSVAIASATLPSNTKELFVMRRHGLLTLKADWRLVLAGCDGPAVEGALAVRGLQAPSYQPLDLVTFDDDFMRESASSDDWEQVSGRWQISATEGKPDMGANPFDYSVTTADKAIALNGNWFWSDYAVQVAARPTGQAVGIFADYQDANNNFLLRLQPGQNARLQLLRQQGGQQKLLAETAVNAAASDWHKLGLKTSHGVILALLDDQTKIRVYQADQPLGKIGLYCEKGQGSFDDVRVTPWIADANMSDPKQMNIVQGTWKAQSAGVFTGSGSDGARVLAPWGANGDCQATVSVRLDQAASAGLHLRYVDPQKYYVVALMADGPALKVRVYRHGNPGAVLAEKAVAGPRNQWHKLSALVQDGRIAAFVDDKPVLNLLDNGHRTGTVGLYARGVNPASFRDFAAMQVDNDQRMVDELTPSFAGIIDRHTWAGRSGAWVPDPSDLDTFWHAGYFPETVQLQAGLHPASQPESHATIYLSAGHTKNGYALVTDRTWASDTVPVTLTRAGQTVAQGTAQVQPNKPYAIGIFRNGPRLLVEVDGKPSLLYSDPEPLKLDTLGLYHTGGLLYADDLTVLSPDVRDYTFEAAPTDWTVESGTWEITSRWSCTPGWAWFSGASQSGYANILTKQAYEGDKEVVVYVAAKMMPAGDGKFSEKLTDIYLGLDVDKSSQTSGYQFVLGGMSNTWTALRRNGVQVASSSFRLSQAGMHNDWLKVILRKRGGHIECWAWNTLVLQYDDPQPLASGRLAIGTYQNGIIVPRVTIFGKQARPQ